VAVVSGEVQSGRGRTFGSLYVERDYYVDGEAVRYTLAAETSR
jgi:hypothetical protein